MEVSRIATTLTVEIPDDTDRSAKVLRAEIWERSLTSGCRSFVILFENQDDSLNGVFSPQNTVEIKLNTVGWLKGYVDTITHVVYDREDTFRHLLRVSGRDYSQDAMNLIHTHSYAYNTRIDDLIDVALAAVGSEITYLSASSESQIAGGYEAKDEYILNIFRDLFERESYDGYVGSAKAFQLIDLTNLPASGLTLKSVAAAADNNIIAAKGPIEYTEADGIPVKNYIKVVGQRIRDGWTDGNASDWTGGTSTAVTNDTGTLKEGASSIKGALTWDGVNKIEYWLDFSGGLYSKTLNYLDWSIYGEEELMYWARHSRVGATPGGYCDPKLQDTTGNIIIYCLTNDAMVEDTWYWRGAPVGLECPIAGARAAATWYWDTNVDGNFTWQIERLGFEQFVLGDAANHIDNMWIDDLRLPEEMVSISEDAASQASYRKRCVPLRKPYFKTQLELDDYATAVKDVLKDPPEYLKLWIDGSAGISGGVKKIYPTWSVTVNIPRLGINSETWRFMNIHHIVEPYVDLDGNGHDWISEVELVPSGNKVIGYIYDALSSGRIEPQMARLEERVRNIEKKRSLSHLDVSTL